LSTPQIVFAGCLPIFKIESLPIYQRSSPTGLLEQWIEYDLAGRVNPYGLCVPYG